MLGVFDKLLFLIDKIISILIILNKN